MEVSWETSKRVPELYSAQIVTLVPGYLFWGNSLGDELFRNFFRLWRILQESLLLCLLGFANGPSDLTLQLAQIAALSACQRPVRTTGIFNHRLIFAYMGNGKTFNSCPSFSQNSLISASGLASHRRATTLSRATSQCSPRDGLRHSGGGHICWQSRLLLGVFG